jgi:hypothetical protein
VFRRLLLCTWYVALAPVYLSQAVVASDLTETTSGVNSVEFSVALNAAIGRVVTIISDNSVPCDVDGAPPIAVWQSWRHRSGESLISHDRGFGEFLSRSINTRLPCASAVHGEDRDRLLRELQIQALPYYDSSLPHFRMAGRQFQRSVFLIAGDWWVPSLQTVAFTIEVYQILSGESLKPAIEGDAAEYVVPIASISNRRVRSDLRPHIYLSVVDSLTGDAADEVGFAARKSIVESQMGNALRQMDNQCAITTVDNREKSDIEVIGSVVYRTCPVTSMIRQILGDEPSYAYTTETTMRMSWPDGQSAMWYSENIHRCPPVTGRIRRQSSPTEAFRQAQQWLSECDDDKCTADVMSAWVLREICER